MFVKIGLGDKELEDMTRDVELATVDRLGIVELVTILLDNRVDELKSRLNDCVLAIGVITTVELTPVILGDGVKELD